MENDPSSFGPMSRFDNFLAKRGWLIACVIGLLGSMPIWIKGVPSGFDLPHHLRLAVGFYDSFLRGDLYPSWLANTNYGLGDPSVRFYPPGLYFVLALFRVLSGDWYFATILVFTLLNAVGCLGAYLYVRQITDRRYALAAAILWLLMPFHTNELYQAGMYSQYAALCILPFAFASLERLFKKRSAVTAVCFAASYAAIMVFNLPITVLATFALAIYVGIRLVGNFEVRLVWLSASGFLLGAAAASFYWLPVLLELKWKAPGGAGHGEWYNYANNFLFVTSPSEDANYWIPILSVVTGLLVIPSAAAVFRRPAAAYPAAILAFLTFLFATPLTKPIWDVLPLLQETQFPWRWLSLTSLFLAVLSVTALASMHEYWRTRMRPLAFLTVGIMAIAAAFSLLQVMRGATYLGRGEINSMVGQLENSRGNTDFLPVWARSDAEAVDGLVASSRPIVVNEWAAEHKSLSIAAGDAQVIKLSLFYYPNWRITVNEKNVRADPDEKGEMIFEAPAEAANVRLDFVEPWTSYAAAAVSIAACLIMLIVIWRRRAAQVPTSIAS